MSRMRFPPLFPPLALPFVFILILLFILTIPLLFLSIVGFAFNKLGLSAFAITTILFFSFIGSFINIPISKITVDESVVRERSARFLGVRYVIPETEFRRSTTIAINLGGAIIPVLLSTYLLFRVDSFVALAGVAIVSIIIYALARPVKGVGIAVPAILPPIITVIVTYALLFFIAPHSAVNLPAAPIAYISGTLGTLIGADFLNLNKIKKLNAPVVSIGGAGTFDGIFLTGLISVLLV